MKTSCTTLVLFTVTCLALASGLSFACGPQDGIAEDQRQSHRLHWETKSEVESAGFNIFRSERVDGDFARVNKDLIPAARFSARVRQYEYIDSDIDPCKTYYYYVDGVSTNGESMRVSETMTARPKKPAAGAGKDAN